MVLLWACFLRLAGAQALFGTIAFVVNFIALASLEGVEVVINLVFSKLPLTTITDLRGGPLGLVLVVSSLLFLFGTLAFVSRWPLEKVFRVFRLPSTSLVHCQ